MVGIRRHAAHARKAVSSSRLRISSEHPTTRPMSYRSEFAPRAIALARTRRSRSGNGLQGQKLTLLTRGEHAFEHKPIRLRIPLSAVLCSGQGDQCPDQARLACEPHQPSLAAYIAAPIQAIASAVCSHWKQNMFSRQSFALLNQRSVFSVTALYCCVSYISVVEPTGEANA